LIKLVLYISEKLNFSSTYNFVTLCGISHQGSFHLLLSIYFTKIVHMDRYMKIVHKSYSEYLIKITYTPQMSIQKN